MPLLDIFFKKRKAINMEVMPRHIAIIPDGNGRWAKKRGLPRSAGHRIGSNTLKRIVHLCSNLGIKYLTIYAFSTENWKRPKEEVNTLMSLLLEYLRNAAKELTDSNIRIRIIGDRKGLPQDIQEEIMRVEKLTENYSGLNLVFALNYGGKNELVNVIKGIARDVKEGSFKLDNIGEDTVEKKLYTRGIPDPDLLIRTSGEKRISNFLLWQAAYTEFWFTDVLWPDFKDKHLMEAIEEYQNRQRRYGGV